MDRILIRELRVRCTLGVNAEERRDTQDVLISVELGLDLAPAGKSDRIEDAVNYRPLKKRILAVAEGSQFHLIEALAERIAQECLAEARIQEATVTVEKPGALRYSKSVAVEIVRRRR